MFVVPAVTSLFYGVFDRSGGDIGSTSDIFSSFLTGLSGLANIAAWVLVIIARVKYKKNTFSKVLLIVYIILLALAVIGLVIIIATCASIVKHCPG